MGKEAVVVAAATTEATTVGGEGDAGDDGEVDGGVVGEGGAGGLLDVEGAFAEAGRDAVLTKFEVVAYDNRQQDALASGEGFGDEVVCCDLIGQGVVEEDGAGLLPLWGGCELGCHLTRKGSPLLSGAGGLAATNFLSNF